MARFTLAAAFLSALASGCVAPARTFDAYEADAVATAEEARSAAATAALAVDASQAERVTANYLTVVLVESEQAAGSAQSQFDSVQPPDRDSDRLHDELSKLLDETTATLEELRVTVRRSELTRLPSIARPLDDLVDRLDRFAVEHET